MRGVGLPRLPPCLHRVQPRTTATPPPYAGALVAPPLARAPERRRNHRGRRPRAPAQRTRRARRCPGTRGGCRRASAPRGLPTGSSRPRCGARQGPTPRAPPPPAAPAAAGLRAHCCAQNKIW
eukprot:352795-Chlamydomonas_euryale.AAC.4